MSTSASTTGSGPGRLNSLSRSELIDRLLTCLDVPRWAAEMADQRPFHNAAGIDSAAKNAANPLTTTEIHRALAAHPRIGDQKANREPNTFSNSEQSGIDSGDAELAAALRAGNTAYEERFGHVYLVCASGRDGRELLEILNSRLDNDADTEIDVVATELREIARLRLAKVIEG